MRIAGALAWLLAIALAAPAAAQTLHVGNDIELPAAGASLPMLEFGGRPVVEATINGKGPFRLILDTGAAVTVLDESLARELGIPRNAELDEIRLGPVTVRRVSAFALPIAKMFNVSDMPRGVLSASAFPGLLVTIDYPRMEVGLRPGALAEADGKTIFSYRGADLPSVPVKVAGREITVHLDTGAPYALALPTRFMKDLPLDAEPVRKGTARTHAGELPIYAATLSGDIQLGEFTVATRDLRFTDVVPGMFSVPKGQLGTAALRDFAVTLDAAQERVRFERTRFTAR